MKVICSLLAAVVVLLLAVTLPVHSARTTGLSQVNFYNGLVNTEVKRSVDLRTNVEEVSYEIDLENTGSESANFYLLPVLPEKFAQLSFYRASNKQGILVTTLASASGVAGALEGTRYVRVHFSSPLTAGASATIEVFLAFTHTMVPYPAAITQYEDQKVQYIDNHYVLSPYKTEKQATQVKLASSNVESRSTEKPTKTSKDVVEYGPYKDVKPFSYSKMSIHFENNFPFVTFTQCLREVEVSHWGNVAVEEHYTLKHTGAALKGSFSRLDYTRGRPQNANSKPAFRTLTAVLPNSARDIYYRDQIGNISSSHVRKSREGTVFEVDPRFPMFGGWKTDFYMGYNIPAHRALSVDVRDPTSFVLNISFSTSFAQASVDEITVRVILPEGATNVRYVAPFAVDGEDRQTRFAYLDTLGRAVLVLKRDNLCRYHIQYIQVLYNFSSSNLYNKPLLLVAGFLVFFFLSVFCMRLDLSISSKKLVVRRQGRASSMVTSLLDKFQAFEDLLSHTDSDKSAQILKDILTMLDEIKKVDVSLTDIVDKLQAALQNLRGAKASSELKNRTAKFQQALVQVEILLSDLAGL